MCSFNFQYIQQPKNARMPMKRQTEAILPIFKKALSVFDSRLLTSTLYGSPVKVCGLGIDLH